jgi:peptidoglycan-binding protein ArfA
MTPRSLVVVTATAALIATGCGGGNQATETSTSTSTSTVTSTQATPTATPPPTSSPVSVVPGAPAPVLEPFVLTLAGDSVTVSGDVADQEARTAVLDAIAAAVGTNAAIVDTMKVNPGSVPFDPAQVTKVLDVAEPVANFGLRRDPDKVTLTGAAPTQAEKDAAGIAATGLFPNLTLVNDITVAPAPAAPAG